MRETGLCGRCRHRKWVVSSRGSRFLRCAAADNDARLVRYPRLPVERCPVFEASAVADPSDETT